MEAIIIEHREQQHEWRRGKLPVEPIMEQAVAY